MGILQVEGVARELEMDLDVRILRVKISDEFRQVCAPESQGAEDDESPTFAVDAVGDVGLQHVGFVHDASSAFEEAQSLTGQEHLSRGAFDQLDPEAVLQLGESSAHC